MLTTYSSIFGNLLFGLGQFGLGSIGASDGWIELCTKESDWEVLLKDTQPLIKCGSL